MTDETRIRYDEGSDTLYMALRDEPAADAFETPQGVLVRLDASGRAIGATVTDARVRFEADSGGLAREIAARLSLGRKATHGLLASTFATPR